MKITHIHIERFRGFQNEDFEVGSQLTAIAGQNGTQKSTLLAIVTQTFTLKAEDPMRAEKPLCGGSYISAFKDKFRLSPTFDRPKGHEWTISFDAGVDDFTVESIKRTGDPNVRFWKKGARQEGDGYLSFPTIFLSLKRLVPMAEEAKIITDDTLLTPEELNEFKQLHNKILIVQTPISSATTITSKNKQSIGVSTELYDWNQNSMGQDNLGKIILALFSFKRLHDKYPRQYKGGILAIDEMDATMYPASQVELLRILRRYASKLNLQILFTTHSMSLLKAMDDLVQEVNKKEETANQVKVLYLKKVDDKIAILKTKASVLDFVDVTLPCSTLMELVTKRVPAFRYPYSIVILDGDVRTNRNDLKKVNNADNILILPGNKSPERLLAAYLYNLSDADPLWSKIANGYTKQFCFREYSLEQINAGGELGRQNAKNWLNSQLGYWGRNGCKIFNPFLSSISIDVQEFKANFDNMIKRYIHD